MTTIKSLRQSSKCAACGEWLIAHPPLSPGLLGPMKFRTLRPGFPSDSDSMRETVIIAAACFLLLIMALALIVHFLP